LGERVSIFIGSACDYHLGVAAMKPVAELVDNLPRLLPMHFIQGIENEQRPCLGSEKRVAKICLVTSLIDSPDFIDCFLTESGELAGGRETRKRSVDRKVLGKKLPFCAFHSEPGCRITLP